MALELHPHRITVRFAERAAVPQYEGSMIRDAFGRAFKESCCPFPHENGGGCPMGQRCPYGYVFETALPEEEREFSGNQQVPRPYVFEPPEDTRMEYEPGEEMSFGFTVVGRAAEYMPYFVYAFSRMGEEAVGRLRSRPSRATSTASTMVCSSTSGSTPRLPVQTFLKMSPVSTEPPISWPLLPASALSAAAHVLLMRAATSASHSRAASISGMVRP